MSRRSNARDRVLAALRDEPGGLYPADLAERAHVRQWTGLFHMMLAQLEAEGLVIGEFETGRYPRHRVYRIDLGSVRWNP